MRSMPTAREDRAIYIGGLVPMHSVTRLKEKRRVINRNHETIQRERRLARRIFGAAKTGR